MLEDMCAEYKIDPNQYCNNERILTHLCFVQHLIRNYGAKQIISYTVDL
jgi:hypothetical protein